MKYCSSHKFQLHREQDVGELSNHFPILQNIQDIRNTLDAGRVSTMDCAEEVDPEEGEDFEDKIGEVQSRISAFFASTKQRMTREPDTFSVPVETIDEDKVLFSKEKDCSSFENVIAESMAVRNDQAQMKPSKSRFVASTPSLNYLIQKNL